MKCDSSKVIVINNVNKTNSVSYYKYEQHDGLYHVKFSGSDRMYHYNFNSVTIYDRPSKINLGEVVIMSNNKKLYDIKEAFNFENKYVNIVLSNGKFFSYDYSNLQILEKFNNNTNDKNVFNYLKQIAYCVSIKTDKNKSLLADQFEKMKDIDENSILYYYLKDKEPKKRNGLNRYIFPFGFNISQRDAVVNAFSNSVSIIEGPPGTGKTQTILNIIANAVTNGKTVAVVSNNNSATENVLDKLKKNDLNFFAAFLGKKDNKDFFIANQQEQYPNFDNWKLDSELQRNTELKFDELENDIIKINELKNEKAKVQEELSSLKLEFSHFKQNYNEFKDRNYNVKSLYQLSSKKINKLIIDLEEKETFPLLYKIYNLLFYGVYNFSIYHINKQKVIENLNIRFYEMTINELENKINQISSELKTYDADKISKEHTNISMILFKNYLSFKYFNNTRKQFTNSDFYQKTDDFLEEYPVVLSTTHSLRTSTNPNYIYDYLIIDESSQVDIVTGALAISCAKNLIIVGDDKQLPNVVDNAQKKETDNIFSKFNLDEKYKYSKHSFLSSAISVFNTAPRVLLKEHYRCHPKIIGFCNKNFYNNQLIILNDNKDENPIFVYKTAEGNHTREHYNQRQIDVIEKEILNSKYINKEKDNIGVITPYNDQKEELQKIIKNDNIEIDTVHKFQGREKDVIIISTVDDDNNDFSEDSNLLNVAVSRAVKKLFLVVPATYTNDKSNISSLIKYIEYNNMKIINSNINSIFDYLYKSRSMERKQLLKNKDKNRYASEQLMEILIDKILLDLNLSHISYITNYPLKSLIKDPSLLDNEEYRFVYETDSHNDFILYNKVTKENLLAIEVDGYAFHANNKIQLARDAKKDAILKRYKIPLIRCKTNHSQEEAIIKKFILEIEKK